jgi:hypothetical protein
MTGKRMLNPIKIKIQLHTFSCCIFAAAFALLVEQTSQYYQQQFDHLYDRPAAVPNVTESEMFVSSGSYLNGT